MSAPKHFLSGTGKGKSPADNNNSKFLQTCNRLNLFLKEKKNIQHLLNAKLHVRGVLEGSPATEATTTTTTIDLLNTINVPSEKASQPPPPPGYVILDSSTNILASPSKPVTKTSQMTIFYGGQVVVIDDVTNDRARDMLQMAKIRQPIEHPLVELASTSALQAKDSDLPIARRASLHKFLAKRKDRRGAPYQVHNHSPGGSSSGNEPSFDLNM